MTEFYRSDSYKYKGENSPTWAGGDIDYYGANWYEQRRKAREREGYCCKDCGITEEELGKELSVHHIIPFRMFDDYRKANELDNLVAICEPCHRKRHSGEGHPSKYRVKI